MRKIFLEIWQRLWLARVDRERFLAFYASDLYVNWTLQRKGAEGPAGLEVVGRSCPRQSHPGLDAVALRSPDVRRAAEDK